MIVRPLSSGLPLTFQDPLFNTTTLSWGGVSGTDLLSLTDPTNLSWAFEYTPTGGRITKVTDPAGQVQSTATYNAFGQLATETVPATVASSGQNETTIYTYDATTGDLMQLTEPHGVKSVVGVINPATHTLVPGTSYDPLGDPLALSVFPDTGDPATSATPLTTQLMWNAAQEMTQAILPNGLRLVNTFTEGQRTKLQTFDPANNLLEEMNYAYDTRGRLYQVSDLVGTVAKYRYDKNDNVTKVIDGRGNSSYVQYGQNNEPTGASSDGSSGTDSVLYDAAGRVRESTDKRGVVFQYSYDIAGKLTGVTIPAQTSDSATYYYDAAGRPQSITRANGDSVAYSYTGANKWLTGVTTTVGSRVHAVSYTYNGDGKRSSMTSTVGSASRTTSYQWDRAGRIVAESTAGFGTTNWIYDFAGRMVSQVTTTPVGGRIGTVYTWGTSGLAGDPSTAPTYLSRITNTANGVETTHWDMTYSLLGQVKAIQGLRSNGDTRNAVYTYDTRGRLTGETRANTVGSNSYTGSSSYTYDLADNLNAGGNGWSYDADNRVTSAPAAGGMPGATGLSYDAAGHLTGIDGKTLSYNALGQLDAVAVPGSGGTGTVTITYDPAGRRFSSTDPGGTTSYYDYDGNQLIGQQTGSGSGSAYADIIDGIGSLFNGGGAQYLQYDPMGNLDSSWVGNGTLQDLLNNQRDALRNLAEGPPGSGPIGNGNIIGDGVQRDPNTGLHSPLNNGGRGNYAPEADADDGTGDYRNALGNFWGAVGRMSGAAKAGLNALAGANQIANVITLATGQNPDGTKANKIDKGFAFLGLVPGGNLGGALRGPLGKLRGKFGKLPHLPMYHGPTCFPAGTKVAVKRSKYLFLIIV